MRVDLGSVYDFRGGMSFLKDFYCDFFFFRPFFDDTLDGVLEE